MADYQLGRLNAETIDGTTPQAVIVNGLKVIAQVVDAQRNQTFDLDCVSMMYESLRDYVYVIDAYVKRLPSYDVDTILYQEEMFFNRVNLVAEQQELQ